MNEPKITVVIPTRERCDVLVYALQTITAQDYDNLEILVSDNHSHDATQEVVRAANDQRVKYLNTGRRLSMSHNWEFALSHVKEGWVTFVGDDDGLLPGALKKVATIIQTSEVHAIRSELCFYEWPSVTEMGFGKLSIPLGNGWRLRDSETWLARVMSGQAGYRELPLVYNGGFISVRVLKEIEGKSGTVFRSCIPDIYTAIAVASTVDRYAYSREPFAVNGGSKHSTGGAQFSPKQQLEGSPVDVFRSEGNIPFHGDVPLMRDGNYPPSMEVFTYESYLQSAFLRDSKPGNQHALQLEVILSRLDKRGGLADVVEDWGKTFANMHALDYEEIRQQAQLRKSVLRLMSIPKRVDQAFNTCRVGSSDLPLRNVYEACVCAAAVRKAMPNRFDEIRRVVNCAMKELLKI
jgi:glycosyltransferase involved in cell wall biosynthesis